MKQFLLVLSFLVLVAAYNDNSLVYETKKFVEGKVDNLPESVKDLLPTGIHSIEEGEEMMEKKCLRFGTNESFENYIIAKEEVQFCIRGLFNFSQIEVEIEKAKPTGDLDKVFRQYCKKSPKIRSCVMNFTTGIESCLSPEEKVLQKTLRNITDAVINFICYKEGDRIALFIAEEGPQCLESQQEEIQKCLNSTFSSYISKQTAEQEDLPLIVLGEKECSDMSKMHKCVVSHLEKCSEPTPANIIDSMIKFVLKSTPCQKFESAAQTGSANTVNLSTTFFVSSLCLFLLKLQ